MKKLYIKDKNRRHFFSKLEKKKLILKYIFNNLKLSGKIRSQAYLQYINMVYFNSHTKIRNRCVMSNRARSVYRDFKISRIFFKRYALEGNLMGVKKASW